MASAINFPQSLKKVRKAAGLTQQGLADRLGLSQNYIAQLESGKKDKPSSVVLKAIAALEREISAQGYSETSLGKYPSSEGLLTEGASGPDVAGEQLLLAIDDHYRGLLGAAGYDVGRLGWISEQMKQHLAVPAAWHQAKATRGKFARVVLPSQTIPHSSETGLPLPDPSHRSRPAQGSTSAA